jgi:hypothetical protein
MSATLSLDLFRPSILDPVEERFDAPAARAPLSERVVRERAAATGDDRHGRELSSERGGGLTLDDLVVEVWEGLSAHRTVACPACGGAMAPRYGAGPAPVGGRCGGCATTIG